MTRLYLTLVRLMKATMVVSTLLLAACSALPTHTQQEAAVCVSYSAALKVLTVANQAGKLSVSEQAQVTEANTLVSPVCLAETPPTLDDLKQAAVAAAVNRLALLAASHH